MTDYVISSDEMVALWTRINADIISKVHTRPLSDELAKERERVLNEFKWMKPLCFGKQNCPECDTRCTWVVRKRCIESLRSEP